MAIVSAAGLASLAGASCVLGGFDRGDLPPSSGGSGTGGAGASGGAFVGGSGGEELQRFEPGCQSLTVPPPPVDATPGGTIEDTFAMDSIQFHEDSPTAVVGLDLDDKCTCQGDGPSCLPPSDAPEIFCDAAQGVDNSGHVLFRNLALAGILDSADLSARAKAGAYSIIIRIAGYNGEPDDAQVNVDWLIARSLGTVPNWDGEDAWPLNSTSFEEDMPPYVTPVSKDDNAYVTDGTLVASLTETTMRFGDSTEGMTVRVVGTILQGELVSGMFSGQERWYLSRVVLTSRWPAEEIFNSLGSFRDPNISSFCKNGQFYPIAKPAVCNAVDIFSLSGVVTPTTPCDSMSFGLEYTTAPARIDMADIADPLPLVPSGCDPGQDPAGDTCDDV